MPLFPPVYTFSWTSDDIICRDASNLFLRGFLDIPFIVYQLCNIPGLGDWAAGVAPNPADHFNPSNPYVGSSSFYLPIFVGGGGGGGNSAEAARGLQTIGQVLLRLRKIPSVPWLGHS
jgi:hypothetical protein